MKRFAFRLAAFLLLGAIINVAVAWWCLLANTKGITPQEVVGGVLSPVTTTDRQNWKFILCDRRTFVTLWWNQELGSIPQVDPTIGKFRTLPFALPRAPTPHVWPFVQAEWPPPPRPDWSLPPPIAPSAKDRFARWTFVELGAGWPRISMTCSCSINPQGATGCDLSVDSGIALRTAVKTLPGFPNVMAFPLESPRILPLRPYWQGFGINTMFYAAILWLVFAGPFAIRRWRRIKRGLCPACAYPIGESAVCTECGHLLLKRRIEP